MIARADGGSPRTGGASDPLCLRLEGRLDVEEALRLRGHLVAATAPGRVELDLSRLHGADGDGLLLLESTLSGLERRGSRVALQNVPRRLHVLMHFHPILRFARDADDLFTDPDLDWPGFRHSAR